MYSKTRRVAITGFGRPWGAPVASPQKSLREARERGRRGLRMYLDSLYTYYIPNVPDPSNPDAPYWRAL